MEVNMDIVVYVIVAFAFGFGFGFGSGWQLGQKDEAAQQTAWRRDWTGNSRSAQKERG
jgi:hypothetical protein